MRWRQEIWFPWAETRPCGDPDSREYIHEHTQNLLHQSLEAVVTVKLSHFFRMSLVWSHTRILKFKELHVK